MVNASAPPAGRAWAAWPVRLFSRAVTTVAYFAYGSNMDAGTFAGRRGVRWRRAAPALLRGWRLALDKPSLLGNGEGMATVVRDPVSHVWGVLYEIDTADLESVEFSEGVLIGHYERVAVTVEVGPAWDGGEPGAPLQGVPLEAVTVERVTVEAVTLASDERGATILPTTRYLGLLLEGAAANGLPAEWIDHLRSIPAVAPTPEAEAVRNAFLDGFDWHGPRGS